MRINDDDGDDRTDYKMCSESANSANALQCRPLVNEHISYKMAYLVMLRQVKN